MNIIIEKYDARYWEEISQIHDEARKIELGYASLMDAFRPLEQVVVEEGLFEYKHVDVASQIQYAFAGCFAKAGTFQTGS